MITAVSSQQRKRKKLVKRFDEARDPYQYSEGCEAGPVTEAQAGVDGQLDGQQQQHPDQLYRDLLQHLRDFADDATDEEDEEDHFSDADDDDFGIKIDRDPDADADGNWIEGADGWKEWTPNRDGGPGAAGLPEQAAGADQGAGQLEGSDWEIDLSLATPSQQEDFCVKVFEETFDIEQETARALWEQQDREVREQLRERNLRARRHLKDIERYVSPDIQANARRRTPLTRLPGAAEGQAPIPKPRTVISKLKPRKIRFEDEVEEDDDGPPSRRTRRHGAVDEAPRQGPRL